MFDKDLTDKINAIYGKNTIRSVYSRMKRIFRLMNIEDNDLNKIMEDNGNKLIEAIEQTTESGRGVLIFQVIKVLNLADIPVPDHVIDKARSYRKKAESIHYKAKKEKSINTELDINKIQQYYYDKLHKPKTRYSINKVDENGNPKEIKPSKQQPSRLKYIRLVIFTILKRCPIRFGEMEEMKYIDDNTNNYINLDKAMILIRKHKVAKITKKQNVRKIPLSPEECDILRECKDYLNSDYVIPYIRKDIPEKPSGLNGIEGVYRHAIKHYCKENGIKYVHRCMGIHTLRSIAATNDTKDKIKINCNINELEQIMRNAQQRGHSLTTILKYYVYGDDEQ